MHHCLPALTYGHKFFIYRQPGCQCAELNIQISLLAELPLAVLT